MNKPSIDALGTDKALASLQNVKEYILRYLIKSIRNSESMMTYNIDCRLKALSPPLTPSPTPSSSFTPMSENQRFTLHKKRYV